MPLIVIVAIVAYLGVAMAFYFGFAVADSVGEPAVNGCCALRGRWCWRSVCSLARSSPSWWLATAIHGEEDDEDGSGSYE